jgi:hypothetical protein
MKKILEKIIYYIILTIAFLILPFSIRNTYLSILIKSKPIDLIIDILSSLFIFLYPLAIALTIRYHIKNNKWPIIDYEEEE